MTAEPRQASGIDRARSGVARGHSPRIEHRRADLLDLVSELARQPQLGERRW